VKQAAEQKTNALSTKAGLDTITGGGTDLRWTGPRCEDVRPEAWRWWTYQWTHVGLSHVMSNTFMILLLGVPLEGLHGPGRLWLMFNAGVLGGAACYFFNDSHTNVVGASGGCYALLGMHLADLVINWHHKKFCFPTLVTLALVVGIDVGSYVAGTAKESASHSAHVGGFLAGLAMGIMIGKNLKVQQWEKVLIAIVGMVTSFVFMFTILWIITREGPQNIWEAMEGGQPWCWMAQVYSIKVNPASWECVSCFSPACLQKWAEITSNIASVDPAECYAKGFFYREGRDSFSG